MYKSLTTIALPITEQEYREDGNLHYSTLATYERGGFAAIETLGERKESPSLLFGSIVDTMLTGSQEEFEQNYLVAEFPILEPAYLAVVKAVFTIYKDTHSRLASIPDSDILNVAEQTGFYRNWRPENRVKAIKEKCEEYYNLLLLSEGKTLVDTTTYAEAQAAVEALKTHESTRRYFAQDNPFDNSIEHIYQAKFKAEIDGLMYSCMADLIVVDHVNKRIYPCDLKTSSHTEYDFYKSFIEWSYYIQANQYAAIIKANIEKDEYFKDFTIMNYRFIVVNKKTLEPLVWVWPYTFSDVTVEIPNSKGYPVRMRNFREIGRELAHYLETKQTVPDGITFDKPNNIANWINKM